MVTVIWHTWLSNHIPYKVLDEKKYPFPNSTVLEWISISSHTLLGMWLFTHAPVASAQYDVMTWKWFLHYDDVVKWKHFPRYWPFMRGIHRSPVNSPHKGQWRGALMFSLICAWINGWVNIGDAGDMSSHRVHYDVTVMITGPSERNLLVTDGSPSQTTSNAERICCFLCCQSIDSDSDSDNVYSTKIDTYTISGLQKNHNNIQ